MVAQIMNTTGENRKGAGEMVPETRRYRNTVTARDWVVDELVTLVGEM